MNPSRMPPDLGQMDTQEYAHIQRFKDGMMPESVAGIVYVLELLLGWTSSTLEVFSRSHFGMKYLTPLRLGLGAGVLGLFFAIFGGIDLIQFLSALNVRDQVPPELLLEMFPANAAVLGLFLVAVLVVGGYRLFEIFYSTYYTTEMRDSRHMGDVWLLRPLIGRTPWPLTLPPLTEPQLFAFGEPQLWLMVGGLLSLISLYWEPVVLIGQWVSIASVALFAKNQLVYRRQLEQELAVRDAQIELAAQHGDAAHASHATDPSGHTVVSIPRILERTRDVRATRVNDQELMQRFLRDQTASHPGTTQEASKEKVS